VFPQNIGRNLSIDEVAVTNGELYTVLTNKQRHGKRGCLVAIVEGTKAETVNRAICRIPLRKRKRVRTITRDLADTMTDISTACFPNAKQIDDRFHVQQLVSDALQEIRVELRKKAIKEGNDKAAKVRATGKYYKPKRYENGDTIKELLARGKYVLHKSSGKWTESQKRRADILFQEFPQLLDAYELTMQFRGIYEQAKDPEDAKQRLQRWYESVEERLSIFPNFETPMQTIQLHEDTIVNYFISRMTNASAESFNAKIKNFRALQRGVSDVKFFLYRLSKLYG
jgi:transposase